MRTKLGDLVDNTNDMNNYDTAQQALHDYRGRLKAYRGAGGEIGRLTQEKERLEAQIFEAEKKRPRLDEVLSQISALNEKEAAQTEEIGVLREKLRAAAGEEARKLRRAQAQALREAAEEKARTLEDMQAQYPAGLPALAQIRQQRENLAAARAAEQRLTELTLPEEEKKILEDGEKIFQNKEDALRDMDALSHLQQELSQIHPAQMPQAETALYEALSETFRAGVPASEEIRRCQDDCRRAEALLAVQKEKRQQAALDSKKALQRQKLLLLAGVVLILAGIAGVAARLGVICAILAGVGVLALVVAVITRKKNAPFTESGEDGKTAEKLRRGTEEFLLRYYLDASEPEEKLAALMVDAERYRKLRQQAQQTEEERQRQQARKGELLERIQKILSGYGLDGKEGYEEEISTLQDRFQAYCRAEAREQERQDMRRQLETRKKSLEEEAARFAAQYRIGDGTAGEQLDRAEDALHALLQAQRELSQAQQALHAFLKENGEEPELPQPEAYSMEQYQEKEKAAQAALEKTQAQLRLLRQERESLCRETEALSALKDELSRTDDTRRALQKKCALADRTIEYLTAAKDTLCTGYAAPVERSFVCYAKELLGNDLGRAMLDRELQPFIDEQGQARSADSFSAGTLDGLMLCMRLSLVDALFKDEAPFLILDDPFVNLDDERTKKALSILQKLSQKRQIIYLTCSTARI